MEMPRATEIYSQYNASFADQREPCLKSGKISVDERFTLRASQTKKIDNSEGVLRDIGQSGGRKNKSFQISVHY